MSRRADRCRSAASRGYGQGLPPHVFRLSCGYDNAVVERQGTAGEAVRALGAHSHVRCT